MPTIQEALVIAVRQHQAGRLADAADIYRKVLAADPLQSDARHLLGVATRRIAGASHAVAWIRQAIAVNPLLVEAYSNLANTCADLGLTQAVLAGCRRAAALRPDPNTLAGLGEALRAAGRPEEGEPVLRQALARQPLHGEGINSLGNALQDLDRHAEALPAYRRAIAVNPAHAEAYSNLGVALRKLERFEEAAAVQTRAARVRPDFATALSSLGMTLLDLDRMEEAEARLRTALALAPQTPAIFNNLANALRARGKVAEALTLYRRAVTLDPSLPDSHRNLGMVLLQAGHLAEAWPEYEWRWRCRDAPPRPAFPKPAWDGGPLEGRTLLVYNEQGLGDTLQFARYAPLARARGGRVILTCQPPLHRLLRTLDGVDELRPAGSIPTSCFDTHASLLSLPGLLGVTLDRMPPRTAYLSAEPELVERHRAPLAGLKPFRIGINWQGNPKRSVDHGRSVPLSQFFPLARLPGVSLVSLQKNHGTEQIATAPADVPIATLGEGFDDGPDAFVDSAALMMSLDLVITTDTAIAHLAGALGRPVWVALKYMPEWRFFLDRDDSPWYPGMRLFRQEAPGDWDGVFAKIERALRPIVES